MNSYKQARLRCMRSNLKEAAISHIKRKRQTDIEPNCEVASPGFQQSLGNSPDKLVDVLTISNAKTQGN
jgi:hypothetical protein